MRARTSAAGFRLKTVRRSVGAGEQQQTGPLKDRDRVRLVSRHGVEDTSGSHGIAAVIIKLSAPTLLLDGELAIYDQQLRSPLRRGRAPGPDAVATSPVYMTFDLLYCDRRDLTGRPLRDRRACPEDAVSDSNLVSRCGDSRPMVYIKLAPRPSNADRLNELKNMPGQD